MTTAAAATCKSVVGVAADPFAKQNIKLRGFKGWSNFVFDYFDFGLVTNGFVAAFDGAGAANV